MSDAFDAAVRALREAFDAAFAAPYRPRDGDAVPLLTLRVGAEPFAVRALETSGLAPLRDLVPVPSARPELLGLTALRGDVVPVFGLARLLGVPELAEGPRWAVLAGREERVALGFGVLEGHVVAPAADVRPAAPPHGAPGHVVEMLHLGPQRRPVLSVPSLLRALGAR